MVKKIINVDIENKWSNPFENENSDNKTNLDKYRKWLYNNKILLQDIRNIEGANIVDNSGMVVSHGSILSELSNNPILVNELLSLLAIKEDKENSSHCLYFSLNKLLEDLPDNPIKPSCVMSFKKVLSMTDKPCLLSLDVEGVLNKMREIGFIIVYLDENKDLKSKMLKLKKDDTKENTVIFNNKLDEYYFNILENENKNKLFNILHLLYLNSVLITFSGDELDIPMYEKLLSYFGNRDIKIGNYIDARQLINKLEDSVVGDLVILCKKYGIDFNRNDKHDAVSDAEATIWLFGNIIKKISYNKIEDLYYKKPILNTSDKSNIFDQEKYQQIKNKDNKEILRSKAKSFFEQDGVYKGFNYLNKELSGIKNKRELGLALEALLDENPKYAKKLLLEVYQDKIDQMVKDYDILKNVKKSLYIGMFCYLKEKNQKLDEINKIILDGEKNNDAFKFWEQARVRDGTAQEYLIQARIYTKLQNSYVKKILLKSHIK